MLTTFPFTKLPAEIRLQVWRSTWTGRIVNIRTRIPLARSAEQGGIKALGELESYTPTQLPSTFFINSESRRETLRYYKLVFQIRKGESRIYFHQDVDIPCIMSWELGKFPNCVDLAETKELIFLRKNHGGTSTTEYKFSMRKIIQEQRGDILQNKTSLASWLVAKLCPKIEWLYWCTEERYEVYSWKSRLIPHSLEDTSSEDIVWRI